MKLHLQPIHKEIRSFVTIGIVSALINYTLFFLVFRLYNKHYLVAETLGFLSGLITSYTLNKKYTFGHVTPKDHKKVFPLYAIIFIFCLGLNLCVLYICVETLKINTYLGLFIATAFSATASYTGSKLIVWRE
jgi:putative flippase GtrA